MPSVAESSAGRQQLAATLAAGVNQIASNQTITFTKYVRYVLPADGYVFWVLDKATFSAKGSLHYATQVRQNEDETIAINNVIFTSEVEVNELNDIKPQTIWVGEWEGELFSFSRRDSFYRQAELFHYVGDAVYPALKTQLINSLADVQGLSPIVSNSLPFWLGLKYSFPLFPSFSLPFNVEPPYIAVHIPPDQTTALQAVPSLEPVFQSTPYVACGYWSPEYVIPSPDLPLVVASTQSFQLTKDKIRLTTYGLNNQQFLNFRDFVIKFLTDNEEVGLMTIMAVHDEKRVQTELGVLAMKKTLEFEVSYHQSAANICAEQLIQSAIVNFLPGA